MGALYEREAKEPIKRNVKGEGKIVVIFKYECFFFFFLLMLTSSHLFLLLFLIRELMTWRVILYN